MSWDMWHVTGTGFDTSFVVPDKYRDFILNHRQSLEAVMDTDTVQNLIHYLTERPNELEEYIIDLDDIRDMMSTWTISEPIACIMYEETGIRFDYPGVTEYGEDCVLFTSRDPWNYSQIERDLTYERLREIMGKYAGELGIKVDNYDLVYSG